MFDIVIVGAGSAGCVLASRLSADPACRVLVLEAGRAPPLASTIPAYWPAMFNTGVDWGYHTEPQAGCRQRRMYWPRGRMLGGSGSLNAMIYMRGLPSDYDAWAAEGCPGWGWEDVLPAFRRSENNARLGHSPLHGGEGELHVSDIGHVDPVERLWLAAAQAAGLPPNDDFNGPRQLGVGLFQATIRDGERFGPARAFLTPAMSRPNLTVRTGVRTLRLAIERGRAVGVTYIEDGRIETAYAASEIVLCGGSIGSPHLLLVSGVGPAEALRAAGVAVRHDLPGVGQCLQDHINIPITYATRERYGVAHSTPAEQAADLAAWEADRSGKLISNWSACGGFAQMADDPAGPDLQLYCIVTGNRDHARYLSAAPGISLFAVLQRPRSRGALSLRSADPLEAPAIDPRYFDSDPSGEDLALLVEGVKLNRRIAAEAPLAAVLEREITPSAEAMTDAAIAEFVRGHCTTLYHPTSTCRMGSDALAVVDPTLRVRGLDGLRVADASVFPRVVSGNTNAPAIMVGERAAAFMIAGG